MAAISAIPGVRNRASSFEACKFLDEGHRHDAADVAWIVLLSAESKNVWVTET
jgi:hypothetical protein